MAKIIKAESRRGCHELEWQEGSGEMLIKEFQVSFIQDNHLVLEI